MAKMYDKPIDKNIPWDGNTVTNDLPVKGSRVEEFIKDQLNHRIGILYYDQQSNKQLAFSDIEDRDKYLENPIENAYLLLGSFDAPANYTAEITLTSPSSVSLLKGQKGNYIEFTFDIKNLGGASVGDSVLCTYTFTSSSKKEEVREVYTSGQSVKFLVDEYLTGSGSIVVSISIVGRTTMAATMVGVTYNVIDLELTSDFDFTTAKESTTTLEVPYVVKGVGVKYMEFYIDGVKYGEEDTITDATGIRTKYIDLVNMAPGRHSLQLRSYIVSNGEKYYSYTLYRDFAIIGESIVTVMISTAIPGLVTDSLTLSGTQYETISFDFGLYDSRQRVLDILFKVNDSEVSTVSTSNGTINSFSYVLNTGGESTISISCEDMVYEIGLDINKSALEIEDPTEGLVMRLSAKGRSNSDTNRWRWTDSGYTATLNNFAYTDNQGWFNDALVISGGATVDINIAPLASNWATTGGTIIFDIETSDVDDSDAILCECMDDNTSAGFRITPNEALIQSSGGAKVKTNYRERERLQLAFIVNKTSGVENAKTVLIVNNGKNERATNFSVTDTFACPKTLTLGDSNGMVTLKLYSIAIYNRALTVEEAFNSWVLSTSDMATIIQRNDIYADGTNTVSPDKVVSRVPVLLITGDMPKLIEANDKKTNIHADVEFRNNQDPSKNFTATGMKFYRQGTSSLSYKIPNLNGELDDQSVMYDYEGKEITAYSFKDKAQPVRLWCFKADVAESSGSHNVGIARLWNKVMYNTKLDTKYLQEGEDQYVLRTNAQRAAIQANYPYDVRTTIDGFPIVVFYRLDKNSEWVCMGQYNFNNDKKTESVFGFKDIPGFDNTNVECWEGLNNTEPIGLYTDISEFDTKWDKAFEARYPDGSTKVNNLKTFATWVNSTKDDINKFSTEKYQHLDVWKVAAYYVYLMRFGAVDQPVKNSMTTTEDGQHYFFINYDNDTINGKRNDGPLVYGPFIDRQTIDEEIGEYAYAGHDSVLWNNLEADQDFMDKVAIIDNAMYAAGLSYSGVIEEFDTNQVDKWCEKLGNINGDYKYLKPFREENNAQYLPMLQGDLKSHRHWWLSNRFEMFDAMWVSGNYKSKAIVIKAVGNTQDKGFTLTAGKDLRYGYGINNDPIQYNIPLNFGDDHRFTFTRNLGIGDPVRIYAANCVQKLQLGEMTDILVEVNMSDAVDTLLGSKIKGLYLGSTVNDSIVNNAVDGINGLTQLIGLEELDIRGFKGIKTLELTTLKNLHKFWAAGSGLNSFIPAVGANLDYVTLPTTIQALRLDKTNINSIVYTPNTTLREVVMKNVTGMDVKSFVLGWHNSLSNAETDLLSTASLTLEGINWTGMTAADVLKLADFGYHSLKGKVTLTSITQEEINLLSETFGPNVFQPTGEFVIDAPASVFLTGPTTILSGETAYYRAIVFPVTEGAEFTYSIPGAYNGSDSEGSYYSYNGIKLYEATGKVVSEEKSYDTEITIRARMTGSSSYMDMTITVEGRTTPSILSISGDTLIKTVGLRRYEASVREFNATLKSVTWSLVSDDDLSEYVEIWENDITGCNLNIKMVPSAFLQFQLKCEIVSSVYTTSKTSSTIYIGESTPIITRETNPTLMSIMYSKGLASNYSYMTDAEAAAVIDTDLQPGTSENTSIFYSYRSSLKTFDEFKYFTGVTTVRPFTFYKCTALTSITLPSSVTTLDRACFAQTGLTKMVLPDTVTTLVSECFTSCNSLTSITFGRSVTSIGNYVLQSCKGLLEIKVDENNTVFDSRNNCNALIKTADNTLVAGCLATIIPDTVVTIGTGAFILLPITEITIPPSVTTIGKDAFSHCTSMVRLVIPSTVKNFPKQSGSSYYDTICAGTTGELVIETNVPGYGQSSPFINGDFSKITVKDGVTTLGSGAFYNCTECTEIELPDTLKSIGSYAFQQVAIVSMTIPDTVTSIGANAFLGCNNLVSVNIPDGVSRIEYSTFERCTALKEITIPDSVTYLGNKAFYGCSSLTSVYIPASVTSIDTTTSSYGNMFAGCTGLESIVVDENNTVFDSRNNCNALIMKSKYDSSIGETGPALISACKNTTIPSDVIIIGDHSFESIQMAEIEIPSSVKLIGNAAFIESLIETVSFSETSQLSYIGNSAFSKTPLVDISLPESLTYVGSSVFAECSLTYVHIPPLVTTLGYRCFSDCTSLATVVIEGSITELGERVFNNCTSLTSITIPDSVTSIGYETFYNCTSLTSITIPDSVTSISVRAFSYCSKLKEITIPASSWGGASIFYKCTSLKTAIFTGTPASIPSEMFYQCNSLEHVTLPSSLTTIGSSVFYGCTSLKTIEIRAKQAPTVNSNTFGTSTSSYTGRNTYNTGENKLIIPQGATGYDTSYWLDPLQNAEKCGFSIEYLPDPDLLIGSWITIDQTITDPATMITGDVNGEHIQLIRNNSYCCLCTYDSDDGMLYVTRLSNARKSEFADSSNQPVLTGGGGDVFMKLPRFWYMAKEMDTDVWGIGFYYGTESPGENWNEWDGKEFIGAYEGVIVDGLLCSISGSLPSTKGSGTDWSDSSLVTGKGEGFSPLKWKHHSIMAFLFYAKYGNTNSQAIIGSGTDVIKQTGVEYGNYYSINQDTSASISGNTESISFWGLENWWGNQYEAIINTTIRWSDELGAVAITITEDDGSERAFPVPSSGSYYTSKLHIGRQLDAIPVEANGTSSTGYCDEFFTYGTTTMLLRSGSQNKEQGGVTMVVEPGTNVSPSSRLTFHGDYEELSNSEYQAKYPNSYTLPSDSGGNDNNPL